MTIGSLQYYSMYYNLNTSVLYTEIKLKLLLLFPQIADGLHYLHSLFIIHRDIKPGNVLVWSLSSQDGVDVRLTDYGVSQFSSPLGLRSVKGTEEYMAPELCKYGEQSCYDEKVCTYVVYMK